MTGDIFWEMALGGRLHTVRQNSSLELFHLVGTRLR